MQSKSLLIAIAAFAVTATGAQAYVGNHYSQQMGLSSVQIQAFQQARDLRRKGEVEKARDVLVKAGVDEKTMSSLRHASHEAIHEAVKQNDFAAFQAAVVGTPLYDLVNTEADFALFKQAHELKGEGKFVEAKVIMDDLGLKIKSGKRLGHGNGMGRGGVFGDLSSAQKDALRAAKEANDKETVEAILREAGISEVRIEKMLTKRSWE
jgi:hypothetical protein